MGGLVSLFVNGLINYGFTALFTPIIYHFGWSYAVLSLAFSLRTMEAGIAAPIIGIIADKIGPRKVTFIGVFVTGLGVILLSRVDSLVMFYLAFIMISIGLSGCAGHVQMIAVANWFRKNAGKAIGLLSMGIGAGGLLVPMVIWLIAQYNWQTTLVILGVGMWIVCLPLSLVVRHKPEQYGYLPDGEMFYPCLRIK
ncbi:MFS transporter [Chloroflexota bacterium]